MPVESQSSIIKESQSKTAEAAHEPTSAQIQERITRTQAQLAKLRTMPDEWRSKDGKNKQEMEAVLAQALEQLHLSLEVTPIISPTKEATVLTAAPGPETPPKEPGTMDVSPPPSPKGEFLTIANVYVPVIPREKSVANWEAIPGPMKVSGGEKFSSVQFVKDQAGLTVTARPGEKLDFSEKLRNTRLEAIDNILEGREELKAFNEIYHALAEKINAYEALNPDSQDYQQRASTLAQEINLFTDEKTVLNLFPQLREKITAPQAFAGRMTDIIKTVQFLREVDEGSNEFIAPLDKNYKMSPFIQEKFAWFAQLINRQLGVGNNAYLEEIVKNKEVPVWEKLEAKGMSVIVGPRGTGKNKLVDHYSALTNRPLFRYACSPDKEERDLTYDVELKDGEVVRVPTRILTAIATPNAILELDEINLLRPNVAKFFNSLFDGDRAVFLGDQVLQAAPGVVFVGLMNPADYDGVEDLPETIDDRSNIMTMPYPPLQEIDRSSGQTRLRVDEALILKNNLAALDNFSDEQFVKIWDRVINDTGTVTVEPQVAKIVKDLKNIVLIADRTRKIVEAHKTRTGETRMERDISLRGTSEAAKFYSENHLWAADLSKLPNWKAPWNAAQYAIAMTYFPHTDTYRKGKTTDRDTMEQILSNVIQ